MTQCLSYSRFRESSEYLFCMLYIPVHLLSDLLAKMFEEVNGTKCGELCFYKLWAVKTPSEKNKKYDLLTINGL